MPILYKIGIEKIYDSQISTGCSDLTAPVLLCLTM